MSSDPKATQQYTDTLWRMMEAVRGRSGREDWLPAVVLMAIRAVSDCTLPAYWEQHFNYSRDDERQDYKRRFYRILDPVGSIDVIERLVDLVLGVDEPTRAVWLDIVGRHGIGQDRCAQHSFAQWFSNALNDPELWSRRGAGSYGVVVPTELSGLMASLVAVKPHMRVLDPACGTGGFLAAAAAVKGGDDNSRDCTIYLFGADRDADALAIGRLRLFLLGVPLEGRGIETGEFGRHEMQEPMDIVLSAPPAGLMFERYELNLSGQWKAFSDRLPAEAAITMLTLDRLAPRGCAALLIPKGLLFRGGDNSKLRRFLTENGAVSAVVNLPAGILAPLTHIETAILILNKPDGSLHGPVIMVDAAEAGWRERRRAFLTEEDRDAILKAVRMGEPNHHAIRVRSVSRKDIAKADFDLRPEHYLPRETITHTRSLEERREAVQRLEYEYRSAAKETDTLIDQLMKRS